MISEVAGLFNLSALAVVFSFACAGGSSVEHLLHRLALFVYVPVCSYGMSRTLPTTGLANLLHAAANANAGRQRGRSV